MNTVTETMVTIATVVPFVTAILCWRYINSCPPRGTRFELAFLVLFASLVGILVFYGPLAILILMVIVLPPVIITKVSWLHKALSEIFGIKKDK